MTLTSNNRVYIPKLKDYIIGTVIDKSGEHYVLSLNDLSIYSSHKCILPVLEFDNATKRNKPSLDIGDIVYAHIIDINQGYTYPIVSCKSINQNITHKDWVTKQNIFGILNQKKNLLHKII